MPTESQNETPRTDAKNIELARDILPDGGHPDDGYFGMMDFARQLEKELNASNDRREELRHKVNSIPELESERDELKKELNEARKNCIKQLDWEQLREERNTLAKELAEAKQEIELRKFEGFNAPELIQLAKENKVMRDALVLLDDYQPDITNLIVLTRDELIAEIEKMPCGCKRDSINGWHLRPEQKCHRCKSLAKVKDAPISPDNK